MNGVENQTQKKPSGAAQKIIAGAVMAGVALALMRLNTMSLYVYDALGFVCAAYASYEMAKALGAIGYKVIKTPIIAAAIATYPLAVLLEFGAAGFFGAILSAFIIAAVIYVVKAEVSFKDFIATVFVLIYPFLFLSLGYMINHAGGSFLLLLTLLIALVTDTFAYFTGKAAGLIFKGKLKKLIPRVSPNKTVVGAAGGIAGCLAVIVLFWHLVESGAVSLGFTLQSVIDVEDGLVLPAYLLTALFAGVISQFGDLFASRIKRECGLKDFGNLVPGHGGIIDRLDAVMFVFAAVYTIIVIF
ncbi:MAG: phosphatidate cytidylyltransferase [Clostridiales bacterium]|jgi:phosphatidate cytidylyltransferase|nr:phosphatidate cytidylyltransferase [Clostridiales bacterium]